MKKIFVFILLVFLASKLLASEEISLRRCMLLPVADSIKGAISYQIYEKLENYLKDSTWCYYRHNSEIMNILRNYKNNIHEHLNNPEVRNLIAEKTNSGSLISVTIKSLASGSEVSLKIYGSNGEDIYIDEKTNLSHSNIEVIYQTLINWLTKFEKMIPYDGLIIGVLGDQFTVDTGTLYGVMDEDHVDIVRLTEKKVHPLLKTIVDWKYDQVAIAKIFHARKSISQGKVIEYESKKKLKVGDWLVLKKTKKGKTEEEIEIMKYPESETFDFGRLGTLGIDIVLGPGSVSQETAGTITRKMSGLMYGAKLDLELWATRDFWGSVEIEKKFASLSKDEGTFTKNSNNTDFGIYKIKAGYRYLPLGFFYGPRVDGYIGYAKNSYGVENSAADGIVAASISGLMFGANGNIPIYKDVRIWVELDFILGASYSEEAVVYGEDESSSSYHLEFGGSYAWNPTMSFQGAIGYVSSKAKFESPEREYKFKDTSVRSGVVFTF